LEKSGLNLSIHPQIVFPHTITISLNRNLFCLSIPGWKLSALGGVLITKCLKVQAISLMHEINYNRIFTMTISLLWHGGECSWYGLHEGIKQTTL